MLHEILFALLGQTGGVIIESSQGFEVLPTLEFIQKGDIELLNKIAQLGYLYKQLDCFIESMLSFDFTQDIESIQSLYIRSFAEGLDQVLEKYRQEVLDIEQEYLMYQTATVFTVITKLSDYFPLLKEFNTIKDEILQNNLKSAAMLNSISLRTHHGNPTIQHAFSQILHHMNQVLMRQIIA